MFPLLVAVAITIFVIVKFELNAWHAALPENEAYTEIGQWGPYVVGTVVFVATLTARIKGWNFDTKDTDGETRGFGWLSAETRSNDESEEALLDQAPRIPEQVLDGAGEAINLGALEDFRRG